MTGGGVRWISTGRGMGSRRGAEGEKAAGGARGERIEVAPRGCGARRGSEHRGVAGGVEDQRAARLVRHVRNHTSFTGVASFPLFAPLHGADPRRHAVRKQAGVEPEGRAFFFSHELKLPEMYFSGLHQFHNGKRAKPPCGMEKVRN